MSTFATLLAATALLAQEPTAASAPALEGGQGLLALRVGRAETVSHGAIEHAVVLIEDGKIVAIGQDLEVGRGIPVLDRPDWVAMPGLVNCYSRTGIDGQGGSDFAPHLSAEKLVLARDTAFGELLEAGVTTLALYPPASGGISGQAVAVRPRGETRAEMLIAEGSYLNVLFRSDSKMKKMIRDGFEKVDEYGEKEKKAREKYDEEVEKAKKKKSSKKKDEDEKKKEEEEEKAEEIGPYEPPELDPKVKAFMDLRAKELSALITIGKAGDFLHLVDAIGEEDFRWSLRIQMRGELDVFHVADRIGELECQVVCEPNITLHPNTMRQRNIPRELAQAGASIIFIPRSDSTTAQEVWRRDVGEIVAAGMDRDLALRAMTLAPAELLGLAERLGSLDEGKDANMVFLNGDPFEPATRVEAVMLEGDFVHGEVER